MEEEGAKPTKSKPKAKAVKSKKSVSKDDAANDGEVGAQPLAPKGKGKKASVNHPGHEEGKEDVSPPNVPPAQDASQGAGKPPPPLPPGVTASKAQMHGGHPPPHGPRRGPCACWLLFIKNLKCKIRDLYTLITEIAFPCLYIIFLIVLVKLYPRSEHDAQTVPDTRPTNILRGLYANARQNKRAICIFENGTTSNSIIALKMKEVWRDFTGPTMELEFIQVYNESDFEKEHENNPYMDLGIVISSTNHKSEENHKLVDYTIYTQSRTLFAPPSTRERFADLDTCRKNNQNSPVPELPDSCPTNGYFYSGFLALQFLLQEGYLRWGGWSPSLPPDIKIQNYPKKKFASEMPKWLRTMVPLLSVLPMAQIVNGLLVMIVTEKETRIKDGLRMVGVSDWSYWLAWFLLYGLYTTIIALVFSIALWIFVLSRVNVIIVTMLFFLFGLSVVTFGFMMTVFFHKPRTAGIVGTLVLQFCGLLFMVQTFAARSHASEGALYSLRVISSLAFSLAIDELCEHENEGVGFGDIFPGRPAERVFYSILFIIFDTCLYGILALYLDQVIPNEMGVRKHPCWCFLFCCKKKAPSKVLANEEVDDPNVEKVPASMMGKEAIRIRNVFKTYTSMFSKRRVEAVKNISLDIYENQITAILGRNGAGKSTLFSMLVGLLPPTSGKSSIFGLDTSDPGDMDKVRKMTGACMQYDLHFGPLTVREHLLFYGQLRGLRGPALVNDIQSILNDLRLTDKANSRASSLSGGQKRKLSVGIALIGDPKIILLDEPSAGVDPVSRRQLWSLLKKKKEGRVILLTTHFLDEADFLADRKAIINNGELKCHGSSLFLKNRFGVGYHVTIETEETYEDTQTDAIIKKYIPSALETKKFVGGKEIKYSLPNSEIHLFPDLFRDLEALIAKNRDFKSYGVSMTTLEEVFLMISNDEFEVTNGVLGGEGPTAERSRKIQFSEEEPEPTEEEIMAARRKRRSSATGEEFNLISDHTDVEVDFLTSMGVLILLRYRRIRRNLSSLFFMMALPTILVLIGLAVLSSHSVIETVQPLRFDKPKDIYPGNSAPPRLSIGKDSSGSGYLADLASRFPSASVGTLIQNYNGDYANLLNKKTSMAALDYEIENGSPVLNIRINGSYLHGPAIVMNAIGNSKGMIRSPPPQEYKYTFTAKHASFLSKSSFLDASAFFIVFLIGPSFTFPAAGMVMEMVKDREMDVRNHLRVNGVTFALYFLPTFVTYAILSVVVTIMQMILLYVFHLTPFENIYAIPLISGLLILFIPSCLLFSASFSYLFDKVETAQTIFVPLSYLLGIVMGAIVVGLEGTVGSIYFTEPDPTVFMVHTLFSFVDVFYIPFGIFYWINKQYTVCTLRGTCKELKFSNYLGKEIWVMVICLTIHIPLFFGLLLMADLAKSEGNLLRAFVQMLRRQFRKKRVKGQRLPKDNQVAPTPGTDVAPGTETAPGTDAAPVTDAERSAGTAEEDVVNEKLKVEQLWDVDDEFDISVLLAKDLKKTYRTHGGLKECYRRKRGKQRALNGFSLVVEEGEVFGLLGHNGAGKTTALKILIAEERPDSGKVKLCGEEIESSYSKAFEAMGYCAQHDPLWDNITFREHMEMYTAIRGVAEDKREQLINRFLMGLQVESFADENVEKLSGGTKRKLSYAISMLGLPSIVLLDEPSTGLDPQSKRFLWNTILGSFKSNRGAILTTHSIEEAEILCSRIGILSKGSLLCIGSPQHLKSKYGTGYTLELKLKPHIVQQEGAIEDKFDFVKKTFPSSEVDEIFDDKGVFHLHNADVQSISKAFALLEKMKEKYHIEEYSFSQTTLEQIFLLFAREDEEEGETTRAEKLMIEKQQEQRKSKANVGGNEGQPAEV